MYKIICIFAIGLMSCSNEQPELSNFSSRIDLGNEVGNGGDTIRCPTSDGAGSKKTYLLDFYEAKVMSNLDYQLGDGDLKVNAKVMVALERIKTLDPTRYDLLKSYAESFDTEVVIDDFIMEDIDDSGYVFRREGCAQVNQIAEQRSPATALDRRYIIKSSLWSQLDDNNKAGLILHEIIYRDALRRGHPNSIAVRKYTGAIASTLFETISQEDYNKILFDLHLNEYVFVPTPIVHHNYYFRHFPLKLNYADALKHCQSLPGLTYLGAYKNTPNLYISDNQILKQILGDDFSIKTRIWEADNKERYLPENRIDPISQRSNEQKFICRVMIPE